MSELLLASFLLGSILALLIYALIEWVQKRNTDKLLKRGFRAAHKRGLIK